MTRVFRSALLTAFGIAVASCVGTNTTGAINATNYAFLQGRVFTVSDQGSPFAQVSVRIPTNRIPSAYALQGGLTTENGDYQLLVDRIADVGALPTPDTLTVFVLVAQQVSGGVRLDSTLATLRFWPIGTLADPQKVDVHTEAP